MMMSLWTGLYGAMAVPLAASLLCLLLRNHANKRDTVVFIAALGTLVCVLDVLANFDGGTSEVHTLFSLMPGLDVAFSVEPLGLVFALVASGLWVVTHIYGVGYMRGNAEKKHGRFFACFAFAIFAAIGIAFSANLLTLFLFYELLTVSTYPLVAHKETPEAKAGARIYIGILMGTSIAFLLTAIVWTQVVAGTLDFTLGGIFPDSVGPVMLAILLALYAFGIGKAALMPFHGWLPAAMVAPTPVSALLHAVAVVKAGVFTMLKVGVYVFGIERLSITGASDWLMWLAGFSVLTASLIAMTKDNLKARLAYSTVSQLSYITLGMALATSMGVIGGGLHIVTHAVGKITLFMCAGAIYVATHKTEISQMDGLGRKMPWVFGAFTIGALSIIGLPPMAGSWSKWALMVGMADTGQIVMIIVLMISSVLNVAYLLPIAGRGFFAAETNPSDTNDFNKHFSWASAFCVAPPVLTAIGCIVLFFFAGDIAAFLEPAAQSTGTEAAQ